MFTGKPEQLESFLDAFEACCERHNITAPGDKYKGLLQYCEPEVASKLKYLPSSTHKDFARLLKELNFFYDECKPTFNLSALESFTHKKRHDKMDSLRKFKRYYFKYLSLVGKTGGKDRMSAWDYNRYFWEGLHASFRRMLEHHLVAREPDLDVTKPFDIDKVVKAAEYLLSTNRFDQHLRNKSGYETSDTESEDNTPSPPKKHRRHKQPLSDSDSEGDIIPLHKPKPVEPVQPLTKVSRGTTSRMLHKGTKEDPDITELARRLGDINISDPDYTALYVEMVSRAPNLRDAFETPKNRAARMAMRVGNPPPQHQQQSNQQPPRPNRTSYNPPGDVYCFGCGQGGHHLRECQEISALLQDKTIIRDSYTGRLRWPNGSRIERNPTETWVQAIKSVKQANIVRIAREEQEPYTSQSYIGIEREDDDASTDCQEELGWLSGEVGYHDAFAAQRTQKVSTDARRQVQENPPNLPHGVEKLPKRLNGNGPSRNPPPINIHAHVNSNQTRFPKRLVPMDIHQNKFEGKQDSQFLPMEIDQGALDKPGNDAGKELANQDRPHVTKVTNIGTKKAEDNSDIIQKILHSPLTLTVQQILSKSPRLQRDFLKALKEEIEPSPPTQMKTGLALGVFSEGPNDDVGNQENDDEQASQEYKVAAYAMGVPREDLLVIPTKIGKKQMRGLFDSGCQVNIISQKMVEEAGLPWSEEPDCAIGVTAFNGERSRCIGKVPYSKLKVTECELPTYGEMYVHKGTDFDLLLGRTFGTENKVNLEEEDDGTYLSFLSGKDRYRFNACPAKKGLKRNRDILANNEVQNQDSKRRVGVMTRSEARIEPIEENLDEFDEIEPGEIEDQGYNEVEAARGEIEEEILEETPEPAEEPEADYEYSPEYNYDDAPTPAQRPKAWNEDSDNGDEAQNTATKARREDLADRTEDKTEDVRTNKMKDLDDNSNGQDTQQRERFEIDSKLHEEYIDYVLKGRSDEEWNAFCRSEADRQLESKKKWKSYKRTIESDESSEDNDQQRRIPKIRSTYFQPTNRSQTLATPYPEPNPQGTAETSEANLDNEDGSDLVMARRSRRARRITDRARGAENQKYMRGFSRRERMVRKTVHAKGAPVTEADFNRVFVNLAIVDREREPEGDNETLEYGLVPDEKVHYETYSGDEDESYYEAEDSTHNDPGGTQSEPLNPVPSEQQDPTPWTHDLGKAPEVRNDHDRITVTRLPNKPGVGRDLQLKTMESVKESMAKRDAAREREVMGYLRTECKPALQEKGSQTYEPEASKHARKEPKRRKEITGYRIGRTTPRVPPNIIRRPKRAEQRISVWEPWSGSEFNSPEWENHMTCGPEPLDPECSREQDKNGQTTWSEDSDDGVKQEPENSRSDQSNQAEGADSGPEPVTFDPWEFPKKSELNEIYPAPGRSLEPMGNRFPENNDDPRVYELLKGGAVLNRYTDLNRDPEIRNATGTTQRLFCKNFYEKGSENDCYGDCIPEGLRYVPRPEPTPNGIMALLEVFPYANNIDQREHHLMAYGVTLATRDRSGKLVYYNGDANIRITEPPAGIRIEVPNRKRTEMVCRALFREPELVQNKGDVMRPYASRKTDSPTQDTSSSDQIAPDALEAILELIQADPILEDNQVRTYRIQKGSHVPITICTGSVPASGSSELPTQNHKERVLEQKDNEASKHNERPNNCDRDVLTILGNDPLAPDHAGMVENHVGPLRKDPTNRMQKCRLDTLTQHEKERENMKKGQELGDRSIKYEATYPDETPLHNLTPHNKDTTEASKDGGCRCSLCSGSELRKTFFQSSDPLISQDDSDAREVELTQPHDSTRLKDAGTRDPRIKCVPRDRMEGPGVIAVPHLVEIDQSHLPPGERSFFGYNVLIVGDLDEDPPSTRQGHAYVHLFNTSWDQNPLNDPPNDRRPGPDGVRVFREHARECLKVIGITSDDNDALWQAFLKRNKLLMKKTDAGIEVSSATAFGDFIRQQYAAESLNNLKNEVRISKVRQETNPFLELKKGENIRHNPKRDEGLSCAIGKDPVSSPGARSDLEDEADDLPELIKSLSRPESTLNDLKNKTEQCECGKWFATTQRLQATTKLRILVPIEVKEEVQDVPIPGSPPPLNYPSESGSYEVIEINEVPPGGQKRVDIPIQVITSKDEKMDEDKEAAITISPEADPAGIRKMLHRILANLGYLSPEIERMSPKEKESFVSCLGELGLLQIACDMAQMRIEGKELDPLYWRKCIFDALVERGLQEEVIRDEKVKMYKERNELATRDPPLAALMVSKENNDDDDDDDMELDTHQNASPAPEVLPDPSFAPTDWYPDVRVPPYVPASPGPDDSETYVPKSPEPHDLEELKDQVSRLEDQLDETTQQLKKRINQLETQVFEDGCTLTNLKWMEAEVRKSENKWRSNRKKTNRRSAPNPREHRYPTRQAIAEEKWLEAKSDIGALVNRIKAIEERVGRTKQEVDQLKEKMDQVLALAPRLEELGRTVEQHRREQGDMNSLILAEITDFKNSTAPAMQALIKQHSLELTTLSQNYQYLYTVAATLLQSNYQNGHSYRSNYSAYGPPFNTPEKKQIGVF